MAADARHHERSVQQVVGFAQVLSFLRGRWLVLSVCGLVGGVGAGLLALLVPKKYESIVIVAIAPNPGANGQLSALGSLASQFGGLASLAGLSMGSGTKEAEALGYLQSDELLRTFIQENDLQATLTSPSFLSGPWLIRGDRSATSGSWHATQRFKKKVRDVSQDAKTRLVTLRVTWTDPDLAAKWANGLIALANRVLREKAIAESAANVQYLERKLMDVNQVEIRDGIFGLIQSEISREMLAEGAVEYAFRVVDPAVSAGRPVTPVFPVWVFIGGILGVALAMSWLVLVQLRRRSAAALAGETARD